jgi:hypothetical protein
VSKVQRNLAEARRGKARRALDQHRIETGEHQ